MNSITGDFECVLQIREDLIQRVFREMHAAQAFEHHLVRVSSTNYRVELIINVPSIRLQPGPAGDGRARATAQVQLLYHVRSVDDAFGPAWTGRADVTVRARMSFINNPSDPTILRLVHDWAETGVDDVTVYGQSGTDGDRLRGLIVENIRAFSGNFIVRNLAAGISASNGWASLCFLPSGNGNLAAIGFNFATSCASPNPPPTVFLGGRDWALALSNDYVLKKLRDAMRARWSALPPPYGPSPIKISEADVCVVREPITGECLETARRRVYLDRFDVSLDSAGVVFSGTARAQTDSWMVPDVSANFVMNTKLSLDDTGKLTITLDHSSIDLNEWYAEVFNFITFGSLEDMTRAGFESALMSPAASDDLTSLFSGSVLSKLVSFGRTVHVGLDVQATSVGSSTAAVIFRGTVTVASPSRLPVARLAVLRPPLPTIQRYFDAGSCWAPGKILTAMAWDFGDGTVVTRGGGDIRLQESHDYSPGRYVVKLTVTDNEGGVASQSTETFEVGLLCLTSDQWAASRNAPGPVAAKFQILEEGQGVGGVTVAAMTSGGPEQGITDASGHCDLRLDRAWFTPFPSPQINGNWWVTASLTITASKAGYRSDARSYFLGDPRLILQGNWYVASKGTFVQRVTTVAPGSTENETLPTGGTSVTVTGANSWHDQKQTDANGIADFELNPDNFLPVKGRVVAGGFIATHYVTFSASKSGYHDGEATLYLGVQVPKLSPLTKILRARLDEWWKWPMLKPDSPLNPIWRADANLSFSTLNDIIAQTRDSAVIFSPFDLFNVSVNDRDPEGAFRKRIDKLGMGINSKMRGMEHNPAIISMPLPIHSMTSNAVQDTRSSDVRTMARAAAVVGQTMPEHADVSAEASRAVALLGRLSLLAKRGSTILPVATLLGLDGDDAEGKVAARINQLVKLVRTRLLATVVASDAGG